MLTWIYAEHLQNCSMLCLENIQNVGCFISKCPYFISQINCQKNNINRTKAFLKNCTHTNSREHTHTHTHTRFDFFSFLSVHQQIRQHPNVLHILILLVLSKHRLPKDSDQTVRPFRVIWAGSCPWPCPWPPYRSDFSTASSMFQRLKCSAGEGAEVPTAP